MALSVNFTSYTRNCKCERAFILCETSLLLKKDRSLSAENVLVLKFDEIIEITELIIDSNSLIKCLFDFHAFFSNSDRGRHTVEKKAVKSQKVKVFDSNSSVQLTGHAFI